ncbi:TPA: hypothetical protein ACH3X2_006549 [Trebouxia sp. C0005]
MCVEAVSRGVASCSSSALEYSDLSAADHMAALLKLRSSVLSIAGAVFQPDPSTTSPHFVIRHSTPHRGLQALDPLARGLLADGHSGQPTQGFCQEQCATGQEVHQA